MAVNKVVFGAVAIMDISDSTVTPETLAKGEVAYDKTGEKITGTLESMTDGKYVWNYYEAEPVIEEEERTDITVSNKGLGVDAYDDVTYCDEIIFENGSVYFQNPTTVTVNSSVNANLLIGKYINPLYYGGIYKIPDDATVKVSTSTYTTTYKISKGTKLTSPYKKLGTVTSDSESTYPKNGMHTDGYWYIRLRENTALSGGTSADVNLQSKSVTPSESAQTVTPDSGYDGLSSVSVSAIGKTYIGSGVTKKSAQTYTPTTSNQTIASGQYLNGAQTIKGDANLIAGNIKKGVSIFGVAGSYEASGSSGSSDDNCEAYLVDVIDPSINFERKDGDIKAWGYAYLTSSSGWSTTTTVYAFDGDKYYKSALYGSPTATNLALSVENGQLAGLPSLTGGTLLITKGV